MHIADPLCFWPVGIGLFEIEIFGNLFQDTHRVKIGKPGSKAVRFSFVKAPGYGGAYPVSLMRLVHYKTLVRRRVFVIS